MNEPFLEITFRHWRPFAAYFYLPRRVGEKSYRTRLVEPGLVIDFNRAGRAIGIEITAPGELTFAQFSRVLRDVGAAPIKRAELAPRNTCAIAFKPAELDTQPHRWSNTPSPQARPSPGT